MIAFALALELALIVIDTIIGHRSHFNVSTVYDTVIWSTMAVMISTMWIATLIVSIMLWSSQSRDPARGLVVRFASPSSRSSAWP